MRTLVILPTYNERENIVPLIERILELPLALEVLVIDDNSPDGTASAVRDAFPKEERVHIHQREKKLGLGTAYTAGFHQAIEMGFDAAVTMDADFSHDPRHLSQLCLAAPDYDLVIGSRYVPGGTTVNWGVLRKIISRVANLNAHLLLSMKPQDCTSGYRLYHTATLKTLEYESVVADGYSYLVEILFRASRRDLKIGEVPIIFVERLRGKSKISRKEIFKALKTILRLRLHPESSRNSVAVRT